MIHITDGQTDQILDDITAKHILSNSHRKSLKDTLETFDFTTFADQPFSEHLGKHNRVVIPDEDGRFIEFVIHETGKYHSNEGLRAEVFTSASYLLLKKAKVINPQTLQAQTPVTMVNFAVSNTEWKVGNVVFAGIRTFHIEEHTNPYSLLKRIASEFNLELKFRVEIEGNKIIGRYVDLVERVGGWHGREVEFGRDLIGIKRVEKTDDLVTALVGLGPVREDGTRLEVIVEDKEALQRWSRPNEHGQLKHLIEIYEPQSTRIEMTESELTQYTRTELNKRINAFVEYEADIADLENVPGMENKKIRFGDTIKIKDTKFNPPLYLEARVHTQERDIVDNSKKHVELGDFIEYTEDEVRAIWQSLQAEIRQKVSMLEVLEVTYTKQVIDYKDASVYQDGTYYADVVATDKASEAEQNAKQHAEQKASEAEQNAKQEAQAYTDAEVEAKRQELMQEIAEKANLEYVDGQLQLKADNELVNTINGKVNELETTSTNLLQRISDNEELLNAHDGTITTIMQDIDTIEGTLILTIDELSSLEGTVQNQQTQINANATAISLKASQDEVDTIAGKISSINTELSVQAGQIAAKAEQSSLENLEGDVTEINNTVSTLVIDVEGIETNVSSLQSTVSGHSTSISSLNTTVSQHAGLIEARVTKEEYETDQNNIVTRFESAESAISQNATDITQRVTLTTYNNDINHSTNGLKTRMSSAESNISQNATAIQSRVTYTEFNDLQIGGRNLIAKSSCDNEFPTLASTDHSVLNFIIRTSVDDYMKLTINRSSNLDNYYQFGGTTTNNTNGFSRDNDYIISFYAYIPSGNKTLPRIQPFSYDTSWKSAQYLLTNVEYDKWKKYIVPFHFRRNDNNYTGHMLRLFFPSDVIGDYLYIKDIKLEEGNKATTWERAPEDTENDISGIDTRLSTAESTITQLADEIELRVEKNGVISSINQTSESIKIQASKINLVGAVTVLSDIAGNLGTVTAGTINGVTINSATVNGNNLNLNNRLTLAQTQSGSGIYVKPSWAPNSNRHTLLSVNLVTNSGLSSETHGLAINPNVEASTLNGKVSIFGNFDIFDKAADDTVFEVKNTGTFVKSLRGITDTNIINLGVDGGDIDVNGNAIRVRADSSNYMSINTSGTFTVFQNGSGTLSYSTSQLTIVGGRNLSVGGTATFAGHGTSQGSANVYMSTGGTIYRSTSSIRYKKDVESLNYDLAKNVVENLRPVWFRAKENHDGMSKDWSYVGLIAEEVHEVEPRLVHYQTGEQVENEDGETEFVLFDKPIPDSVQYPMLSVYMIPIVQECYKTIKVLTERVEELENQLKAS